MQDFKIPILIVFWIGFASLGLGLILSHLLFKSLKEKYPAYYKSIGRPRAFSYGNITFEEYIRLLKSGVFVYPMVFRGIPKNFPKDKDLRKLAQLIRIVMAIMIVLYVTLIIAFYFLYQYDHRWSR